MQSYNPTKTVVSVVWAVPLSLATTYGITDLFSFPPGTQMFQFSGFPPFGDQSSTNRVAPFRYLRIKGYYHLPTAFRRQSRLSSSLRAKASPVYSYLLSYLKCLALEFRLNFSVLLRSNLMKLEMMFVLPCFQYVKERQSKKCKRRNANCVIDFAVVYSF